MARSVWPSFGIVAPVHLTVAAATAKLQEETAKLAPIIEERVAQARAAGEKAGAEQAIRGSRVRRVIERDANGQVISSIEQRIPLPAPDEPHADYKGTSAGFRLR